MGLVLWISAVLAGVIHVLFFCMESLWWTRPAVYRRFRSTEALAQATRSLAFNQGFYNLFLAIGIAAGIAQIAAGATIAGRSVVLFACLCMVWAGIVLLVTSPRSRQAALIQLGPPLVAIVASFVLS